MKRFLAILVMILLLPVISLADIQVETSTSNFCAVSPGRFEIKVTNDQSFRDIIGITALGRYRSWTSFNASYVELEPGESAVVLFNVDPPERTESGTYFFEVLLFSTTDPSIKKSLDLCVAVLKEYNAEIRSVSIQSPAYNPTETVRISVDVANIGTKDFEDMHLYGDLYGPDGNHVKSFDKVFSVEEGAKKKVEFEYPVGKYEEPGRYRMEIELVGAGISFGKETVSFRVNGIESVREWSESDQSILSEWKRFFVKNEGNVKSVAEITEDIKGLWAYLVTASGDPEITPIDGGNRYTWRVELNPGEEKSVEYQINYWPLFILLVLFGYGVYNFISFVRKPVLKKSVERSRRDKGAYTVTLEIKNRTGSHLENVIVKDFVPSLAKIEEKFHTIRPVIRKTDKGSELIWRLSDIKPGHEKILTYRIKMLVDAVDFFRLPRAIMTAKTDKGRKFREKSDIVKVSVSGKK